VAAGFRGIVVADSHRVDCAVKKERKVSRKSIGVKQGGDASPDHSSNVRMRIEAAIRRVPKGKVSTYGAIARAAGFPGGARQVAKVLHRGYRLPWQRVLGAGGEIKLRGDSAFEQRLRLEAEGVHFRGRRVDMKAHEFKFARSTAAKRH